MGKTKSQAQKREEREEKNRIADEERKEMAEIRRRQFQAELEAHKSSQEESSTILSKKERRKMKHAQAESAASSNNEIASPEPLEEDLNSEVVSERKLEKMSKGSEVLSSAEGEIVRSESLFTPSLEATFISNFSTTEPISKHDQASSSGTREKEMREYAINLASQMAEAALIEKADARVVHNHSTLCPGLEPKLARLKVMLPGCTIIPGPLSNVPTHINGFKIHFQRKEESETYKFVVRRGKTAQDLSIVAPESLGFNQEAILNKVQQVAESSKEKMDSPSVPIDFPFGLANRALQHQKEVAYKQEQKIKAEQAKQKENERKQEKEIARQQRKLANKPIASSARRDYAERDVEIISGRERTRHSMK